MLSKKNFLSYCLFIICFSIHFHQSIAQSVKIDHDSEQKKIVFGNERINVTLDYNKKVNLSSLIVNGEQVIAGDSGVYSLLKTIDTIYSTLSLLKAPVVKIKDSNITISKISYGDKKLQIEETWKFTVTGGDIRFNIERSLSKPVVADQIALPIFIFKDTATWEGAYQDYGGLAWFYLFRKMDTYGVHSSTSKFWNSRTNNGLTIAVEAPGKMVAMDYNRTATNRLACTVTVSPQEITPRFDSGTYRRRFIRDRADVWAPVNLSAGKTSQTITLSYFNFKEKYGRGNLVGINGEQVNAVLNTIARIGVIDKQHFGGNSWHTPYGPICLHEQYIAQMGLAINDPDYLKGYQECLDYYRDNAITADGRVWSRWAYSNEDAMPQQFTSKGFYEAQWGYLLDANPDFVTNVAELYHQNGDINWVKTQQQSCEKALDWIIKRDSNNNGLVEMITDSTSQRRGSDWIDIIWAAYENAFVNAKLYYALQLWIDIEKQLGDTVKAGFYQQFAQKLRTSFNKSTAEGGFWSEEKKCYIHWRDKDGSIHGTNMVTPVNFVAIAYGICNDENRTKTILDDIEEQMKKEQLFFWPLCMYSYAAGEGNDWQFPFPNYENGDIFLSWGSVGVKAYADYKPELALKYVKNVLAQYAKDGLAFQRYGRLLQDGRGDDILSGNSLSVVGLYQAIFGINPMYNRFYLDPHITKELAGTQVKYNYRNQQLIIDLDMKRYAVSNGQFKIISNNKFGFFSNQNELLYFNQADNDAGLKINTATNLTIDIKKWTPAEISFTETSTGTAPVQVTIQVNHLMPVSDYSISINGNIIQHIKTNGEGSLTFNHMAENSNNEITISINEFGSNMNSDKGSGLLK